MSSSQLNASLIRLKLLDALRSGEISKVDAVIEHLQSTKLTIQTTDIMQLKETILHYAVKVAPLSTIQYLVNNSSKFNLDINAQDHDGNTPLHLAAASSRAEVVKYLLSLPDIIDTTLNVDKKQPVELCKDLEIAQLMQFERAKFVETLATQLREYFTKRDFTQLENLLVHNPRAAELLDINGADPETGNTVLHEFILKNDLQMCEWILKHGGDPFKRDKRGKLPIDLIHNKSDPIRKLLKVASKDQTIMDPALSSTNPQVGSAPTYKGYLKKWTNFASGYKLRYFVLDDKGILSYYTNQDDTNNACRGSLNLGFAFLHLDSSEKLKFEIIGKNGIRWHLKANHPIETNRWVWNLQNAITASKDNIKKNKRVVSAGADSNPNEELRSPTSPIVNRNSTDDQWSETGSRKHHVLSLRRKHKRTGSSISVNSLSGDEDGSSPPSRSSTFKKPIESPNLIQIKENSTLVPPQSGDQASFVETDNEYLDYDLDDLQDDYDTDIDSINKSGDNVAIQDQISTIRGSLEVEISSILDLFNNILQGGEQVDTGVFKAGHNALIVIQDLFAKYNHLILANDLKNNKKLERQLEVNKLWESSIRQLEKEIANREQKLAEFDGKKKQLKKFLASKSSGNTTPSGIEGSGSVPVTPSDSGVDPLVGSPVAESVLEDILNDSDEEFFDADEFRSAQSVDDLLRGTNASQAAPQGVAKSSTSSSDASGAAPGIAAAGAVGAAAGAVGAAAGAVGAAAGAVGAVGAVGAAAASSSQKDAPSDAPDASGEADAAEDDSASTGGPTDADTVVGSEDQDYVSPAEAAKAVKQTEDSPPYNDLQVSKKELIDKEGSFLGYENPPRTKLKLDEDDRPKVGLWGILKSMIGKDMTRMTLPVSFNECTSLLQRLAEDIEYSNLLEKAATFDDSTLRTAYVAAFAASEYASTINRIAKPFNPLLGETFEYCRPDKNYRLISEQVSHHPPISACRVESIKWDYYGENAVDSKFRGRSFDFKHLGKMFAVIRPDKGVIDKNGKKVEEELYSWKKVNTSVVGIIVGNPTVDNFGEMEVTNHTTGDKIVVDLKQRGWRASSAYQLSGTAVDKNGQAKWAIGGHWNSKIFGKKLVSSKPQESAGRRASLVEKPQPASTNDPFQGGAFLIWEAAPRPKVPFNLTAFAITLNGIDKNLAEYLPPSDTRLRPDQRAMEDGEYDKAADEKHRVEEKQRAARKERELRKETYKPNWFVKRKHPVTGDTVWEFKGDYWQKRQAKALEGCADIF